MAKAKAKAKAKSRAKSRAKTRARAPKKTALTAAPSEARLRLVPVGSKVCKPFLLEVMVFSPEAGFKFKVMVERACTPEADAIWKLVFDLFQVQTGNEVQVVHVSYTTGTPVEARSVELMASEGVKPAQAAALVGQVHPATKAVIGVANPTPEQQQLVLTTISNAINA